MRRHPIRSTLVAASLSLGACAHPAYGPSSDDRLAAEVHDSAESAAPVGGDKVRSCDDLNEPLERARNGERPEAERLRSYMQLYRQLLDRTAANQKLFRRHPELAYGGGKGAAESSAVRAASDHCQQLEADARSEFELLVRELFEPLVITDLASGHKSRVPRVSFILLKSAVQELAPPDQEGLIEKIGLAEKLVDPPAYRRRK